MSVRQRGLRIVDADCTFFLGWHLVRAIPRPGIAGLKSAAFAYLQRRGARQRGLRINDADCTYFVGWHLVRAKPRSGLAGIKAEVFAYLQRRSTQAAEFFRMPTKRVVMLATEIDI